MEAPSTSPSVSPACAGSSSPSPRAEAEWVAAARGGDRDAFDRLAVASMPVLLGTARRLLGDRHAAEEAVAEALFLAWQRLRGFRAESLFSTWAHRILCRVVADRMRKEAREQRRRKDLASRPAPTAPSGPARRLALREEEARLRLATEALPPTQRLVLLLVVWEGLGLKETADVLGMRYRTVKSNLHHARKQLGRMLEGAS